MTGQVDVSANERVVYSAYIVLSKPGNASSRHQNFMCCICLCLIVVWWNVWEHWGAAFIVCKMFAMHTNAGHRNPVHDQGSPLVTWLNIPTEQMPQYTSISHNAPFGNRKSRNVKLCDICLTHMWDFLDGSIEIRARVYNHSNGLLWV